MNMKKGLLCILLAFCLTAALAACDGAGEDQGSQTSPSAPADSGAETGTPEDTAYTFETGGVVIAINENMADVLAALGEPQSYFEAASCAFDGLDKTYTYAGFVITTRPDGENDFVNSILLTDDSVTTREGVYIGCSSGDVTAAYSEASGGDGVLSCARGDTAMNFILEDDAVISIEYLPA